MLDNALPLALKSKILLVLSPLFTLAVELIFVDVGAVLSAHGSADGVALTSTKVPPVALFLSALLESVLVVEVVWLAF